MTTVFGAQSVFGADHEGPDPATEGRWLAPFDGEVPAVNLAVLTPDDDGSPRVMYYSGIEVDEDYAQTGDVMFIWNTYPMDGRARVLTINGYNANGTVDAVASVTSPEDGGYDDLFCSGTTILPDGTVLVTGSSQWYTLDDSLDGDTDAFNTPLKGGEQTMLFDPATSAWDRRADMEVGRWYPSVITLADGDALVASGIETLFTPNTHNQLLEVYDADADSWTTIDPVLSFGPGAEVQGLGSLDDASGVTTGVDPVDETKLDVMNLPLYPRLFVVPGGPLEGDVFYSTVGTLWGPFGERPEEAIFSLQQSLDLDTGVWTVHGPSLFGARQHANVVPLLLEGPDYAPQLLTFGGTLQRSTAPTTLSEIADLSTVPPTNTRTGDLNDARWHANGVLLPDGTVMAVGGGEYDNVMLHGGEHVGVKRAELFDPDTGEWTTLAEATVPRGYHSTAVLLPDGRVMSAGHVPLPQFHKEHRQAPIDGNGDGHNDFEQYRETRIEIFEPPYLFIDDTRPVIEGAVAAATYGQQVTITVGNLENDLDSVVLMRPGATTHAFDADQRGIVLDATVQVLDADGHGAISITFPSSGNVAPPGNYMLFVNEDVDGQTFPSEASFVRLGPNL